MELTRAEMELIKSIRTVKESNEEKKLKKEINKLNSLVSELKLTIASKNNLIEHYEKNYENTREENQDLRIEVARLTDKVNAYEEKYGNLKIHIVDITEDRIVFSNLKAITYDHCPDCCECNYADFGSIDEEGIKDIEFDWDLQFEKVDGAGFRFGSNPNNMVFVPCYSDQNGYYSSDLEIYYDDYCVISLEAEVRI